jgi:repressor LexA
MLLSWDFVTYRFASFGTADRRLPEQRRNSGPCESRSSSRLFHHYTFERQFDRLLEHHGYPNACALIGGSGGMATNTQPPSDDDHNHAVTETQQKILDCYREWVERHGYPPTLREIADAVGLKSPSTVFYHLKILKKRGFLTFDPGRPRTIVEKPHRLRVIQQRSSEVDKAPAGSSSRDMVSMPLFERMAAGPQVTANPEPVDTIQLPRDLVGYGVLFAVRVVGDSMINANIFDGDCVVVRQQHVADNGDIVAALIGEDATVKTFRRVDGHVWLMPESPNHEAIPGDHCHLMGKVVTTVHRN